MKSELIIQHKDGRQVIGVEPATLRLPGEHAFPYWTKDNISYFRKDGWELFEDWNRPAAKSVMKAVSIEHDEWKIVSGVQPVWYGDRSGIEGWTKEGAMRYKLEGWREVKEKKWGLVDTSIDRDGKTLVAWVNNPVDTYPVHFNLEEGYRWKTVLIEKELP